MIRLARLLLCMFFSLLVFASCKKNNITLPPGVIDYNLMIETEPPVQTGVTQEINALIGGYYSALPAYYTRSTKNYPLLIFLPGGGQLGNGSADLPFVLNDGAAQMIRDKKIPGNFNVNGKNFSFIILSPQFSRYPSNQEIASFIEFAKKAYRVDSTRIYLGGLSMGGIVTTDFAAAYPNLLAAIAPMSGVFAVEGSEDKCAAMAAANLPVWEFHNNDDPSINAELARNLVARINSHNPKVPARLTLFSAAIHDSWTAALNPLYKEASMNVYEWMLQYTR